MEVSVRPVPGRRLAVSVRPVPGRRLAHQQHIFCGTGRGRAYSLANTTLQTTNSFVLHESSPVPPPPNPQEQHTAPQWKTRKLYASDHLKKSPPSSAELTAPCTHAPKSSMHSLRKAELALKTAQTQSPLLRPLLSKTASGHMLCWHYNHT